MILTISEIKERITPICEQYNIKKVFLFGSYARGEANENSDVDLHIEPPKGMGLFQLSGFRLALEKNLNKAVGVITCLPSEYKIFTDNVENEEILLYEGW